MRLVTCLLLAMLLNLPPVQAAEKDPVKCGKLRVELRSLDSKARHRSTPRLQERRRLVRERMYDLKCSSFGSRAAATSD